MNEEITPELVATALAKASPGEKYQLQRLLDELSLREKRARCQGDFIEFVKSQYPDFISGEHHKRIAKLFEDIAEGRKKRVIINLAPRHSKSLFASYLFPAWFLGRFPKRKLMQISNTAELAEGFGRQVRNLIDSDEYREIFPDVALRADSKAAGRWNTNHGGESFSTGVGAALAGRGADLCLAEGSIISNGRRVPIEAVQVGDRIATISGWERVTGKKLTIHDDGVSINGKVTASKGHPFMTTRGWVNAGDLTTSDRILTRTAWQTVITLLSNLRAKRGKG